jgi:hypothetical protein
MKWPGVAGRANSHRWHGAPQHEKEATYTKARRIVCTRVQRH